MRDTANDGRKCSYSEKTLRVFDLRESDAQESSCKAECAKNGQCVAFSGIWNTWCIGCKLALDDVANDDHPRAIAFKKEGTA